MHRFYTPPDSFHDERVLLNASETRHLRDVLRLGVGSNVNVFDGEGHEFLCTVTLICKIDAELLIISEQPPSSPESTLDLTLAATMLKGDKFDLVVQKSVELGVNHLVALNTIRCDVKIKESTTRIDRWRKIALEAAKQSGRARLMKVSGPVAFDKFLQGLSRDEDAILFAEREGGRLSQDFDGHKMTAIVGPEGGWDDSELADARSAGIDIVTLGGRIMRAETAAIAIAAVIQHRFGDIN